MIAVLGLVAVAGILACYAWMVRTGKQFPFDLANAVGAVPIGISAYMQRAWPSLMITSAFGIIGLVGVFRTLRLWRGKPNPGVVFDEIDWEKVNREAIRQAILLDADEEQEQPLAPMREPGTEAEIRVDEDLVRRLDLP